ncbi:MAG: DUF2029 domain-containing protein [Alphaproteobacteria bacterium]|nr:DUF2029 domain-containing protein [Alphaproteobacteria bacterium]NNF25561.1 DUF2029 domain-containing protein [Paracoccaceae bacterium]
MAALVLCALAAFHVLNTAEVPSSDLYATWLAGTFYRAGDLASIYPVEGEVFTMRPPAAWVAYDRGLGGTAALFPFIYPPIWAVLASYLVPLTTFGAVVTVATWINAALIAGMLALAWRAARVRLGFVPFVLIGFIAIHFSLVGFVATLENQPQILVSFLMVLTVERLRAGDDRSAGAALALAAAIKVYPAFFALFFIASRNWRAVAAFAVVGGGLGLLSIALAGWPLHAEYLAQLSLISRTVLLTAISYNVHALIGNLVALDGFTLVESLRITEPGQDKGGWMVTAKPAPWVMATTLSLIAAFTVMALAFARADIGTRSRYIWPIGFAVVTLLSPISWSYYLLPVFAFLPVLIDRHGPARGLAVIAILVAPFLTQVVPLYMRVPIAPYPIQFVGTAALALIILTFALAARTPKSAQNAEQAS